MTVLVYEKVLTSIAKLLHITRTSLLYLSLPCFLRLQYTTVSILTTWSKNDACCCFILGATHTKVKGIWWTICYIWLNEVMPRSQFRREFKETGSEYVQWTVFFSVFVFLTLNFFNLVDILWSLKFIYFSLPVNRK